MPRRFWGQHLVELIAGQLGDWGVGQYRGGVHYRG